MGEPADERVSTLELFFDLVFVFTITQVATLTEHHPSWASAARGLAVLAVVYWMYGGFAWLTNTLGSQAPRQRTVLLLGMAAFFLVSLAVPDSFGRNGVAFGWAYLLLTVVHLSGFGIGGLGWRRALASLGAINLTAAGLVLAAGYLGGAARWPLWLVAIALQWGVALATRVPAAFTIGAAHFGERHGLMVLIALGESLVSVALAAQGEPIDVRLALGGLCGLAASAAMWWCYFVGEDDAAAAAFQRFSPGERGVLALRGYDVPHVFMLGGIVAVAAGVRYGLPHLTSPAHLAGATLIAGGAATYLLALAAFRALLRFATPLPRLLGAAAVLATIPLGTGTGTAQQLVGVAAVLVLMLLAEHRMTARSRVSQADPAG